MERNGYKRAYALKRSCYLDCYINNAYRQCQSQCNKLTPVRKVNSLQRRSQHQKKQAKKDTRPIDRTVCMCGSCNNERARWKIFSSSSSSSAPCAASGLYIEFQQFIILVSTKSKASFLTQHSLPAGQRRLVQ